ncbi:hypothetical protein ABC974_27200 [Sphingomonas oligophenolica]|uniref:Uncharacterized protein n=1 Tax=Sphingomonas oligophenolica TaxID=301154 RepID=A0ABU9YCA3_9SPHN
MSGEEPGPADPGRLVHTCFDSVVGTALSIELLLEPMACGMPFVVNRMGASCITPIRIAGSRAGTSPNSCPQSLKISTKITAGRVDGSRLQRDYRDYSSYGVLIEQSEQNFACSCTTRDSPR